MNTYAPDYDEANTTFSGTCRVCKKYSNSISGDNGIGSCCD
jgi:hypothetical protein